MPKQKLTPDFVRHAKPLDGSQRTYFWDATLPRFGLMVTANGAKSYVVQYRHRGSSRRLTMDGALPLSDARREAQAVIGRVAKGEDVVEQRRKEQRQKVNAFEQIGREYLKRNGSKRSLWQYRDVLDRLIFPKFGNWQIDEIKRSDIARFVDKVRDDSGPGTARRCLAVIRAVMNWHAARSDDFRPPVVSALARELLPKARERILDEDEIRAVWQAAEDFPGPFGAMMRFLLLTGARRTEAWRMRWVELSGSGWDWTLPASRNKTNRDLTRPLSGSVMAVINGLPRLGDYVFTLNGKAPIGGLSDLKRQFDKVSGVKGWTLHDLRRTARSLMSRAGVPQRHAEQCLGHVIGGIEGIYDRHNYQREMQVAYEKLASLIGRILEPQDNVVPIHELR